MAKRIIEELIDDLDGTPATGPTKFSLDGSEYTIDLSAANTMAFREVLAPYINVAVKIRVGKLPSTRGQRQAVPSSGQPVQNRAIREWAQGKGITVSDRGRISQALVDRYNAEAGR